MASALVEELLAADEFKWIAPTIAEAARLHKLDLKTAKQEEVEKITPKPLVEQLVEATVKQVLKVGENWTGEMGARLQRLLLSDPAVRRCLKLAEMEDSQPF